jgi:hypothetical protein
MKDKDIINRRLQELYALPTKHQYTDEELQFIMDNLGKKKFRIKYAIFRQHSHKGLYISFIIDRMPYATRRTVAYNSYEVICEREISDKEYIEECQNFGCGSRTLHVYYYKNIELLIEEDKLYNVDTPQKFIDECVKLGYTESLCVK